MSLFRNSDYAKPKEKVKNQKITSKKARLPTEFRTKRHSCSLCPATDAQRIKISDKEYRWLCPKCQLKFANKDTKEKPHFLKASRLYRE